MSKLGDYDFRGQDQEIIDFKNDVITIVNFGKIQKQTVTSVPAWRGRKGEEVYLMSGTTGVLYVCTSDNTITWKPVVTFSIA
jgi:hypothetical protein